MATTIDINSEMQAEAAERKQALLGSLYEARGELSGLIDTLEKASIQTPEQCESLGSDAKQLIDDTNSMLSQAEYEAGDIENHGSSWQSDLEYADEEEDD